MTATQGGLREPVGVEQIAWLPMPKPRCAKCGQEIRRGVRYHRVSFDLDGPDSNGVDLCLRCAPEGSEIALHVTNPA